MGVDSVRENEGNLSHGGKVNKQREKKFQMEVRET